MQFACCDVRKSRNPRVILSLHEDYEAAEMDMDKRVRADPDLPWSIVGCPDGKNVGDLLTLAEINEVMERNPGAGLR